MDKTKVVSVVTGSALLVGAGLVCTGIAMLLEGVAAEAASGAYTLGRTIRGWVMSVWRREQ